MIALIDAGSDGTPGEVMTNDGGGSLFGSRTPYVSSGGFSMPSIGSTFDSPVQMAPTGPSDAAPSIPFSSPSMLDVSAPGASGTPSYSAPSGASDGGAAGSVVPSVSLDYFDKVVDLVKAQLTTGQPSAAQSFNATPVALPSGGAYGGQDDGSAAPAGGPAAGRSWLVLVALVAVAGGAYYWFVYRKKASA